jgi:hypothetical protein
MNLYQILDEKKLVVNEFQQRDMALCHLDIIKELSPDQSYNVNVRDVEKNYSSHNMATHLIKNFG